MGNPIDDLDDDEREDNPDAIAELDGAVLGEPFAMSSDVELVEAWAVVKHEDGRQFKINLLKAGMKHSPYTQQQYSHALVIAPADDPEMVSDVVRQILAANGVDEEKIRGFAEGRGEIPEG